MISRTVRIATAYSTALAAWSFAVRAQEPSPDPKGGPPPDPTALFSTPKEPDLPDVSKPVDGTTASISAGGQLATGNTRMLALTLNSSLESRFHDNGLGAAILANYGEGAAPGKQLVETADNVQGRLRYDRYFVDRASSFLIATARHDRFQGLDLRLNFDPGFKYLVLKAHTSSLWLEGGYDLQYDIRRRDALTLLDSNGKPVLDAMGNPQMLPKTATDHSSRVFYGFRKAFNDKVTLTLGLEYLQSFVDIDHYRLNFEGLFAAKVSGGLAVGFGVTARYDHAPLPGKLKLDTATTISLVYAYSDVPTQKKCP